MKDPKEVSQEAYDGAIEDGASVPEAEVKAEEARVAFESSLIDDAMGRLDEDPKLKTQIEARVAKLDMGGRVYGRCSMCGRDYETAPEMLHRMQKDDTAELLRCLDVR